jgi:hypothetical protein
MLELQNPGKAPLVVVRPPSALKAPPTHAVISTARARAQGTRSGKAIGRPKVPAEKIAAVRAALVTGDGIRKVARAVVVS